MQQDLQMAGHRTPASAQGAARTIELIKVNEQGFDRGERAIMVDGVRWGRTIVTHHGCHGTKHVFKQEEGDVILGERGNRYSEIAVRSQKRRRWLNEKDDWQPTEQKVFAKVKELIETGKLRHPDVVKKEKARSMARMRQRMEAQEQKRVETFRAKAMEALQINDPDSAIIERVVAAMEWARES